jgi:hypothetical protein
VAEVFEMAAAPWRRCMARNSSNLCSAVPPRPFMPWQRPSDGGQWPRVFSPFAICCARFNFRIELPDLNLFVCGSGGCRRALPWELRRRALVAAPAAVSMAHSVAPACITASRGLAAGIAPTSRDLPTLRMTALRATSRESPPAHTRSDPFKQGDIALRMSLDRPASVCGWSNKENESDTLL